MIVRGAGESWQIVSQLHHADLSGQFAAAWGNDRFSQPTPASAVEIASIRHDDGWAVWERWPKISERESKPLPFLDVHILSHLAFYRAAIEDAVDQDPYAGLLVSMHGAGIYRGRYGTQPELRATYVNLFTPQVDAFVNEQEIRHAELIEETGVSEQERWVNYKLLQVFDRLSLYFSGLFEIAWGDAHVIGPVPVTYNGEETTIRVEALTQFAPFSPSHVRIDPFPFSESPAAFTVLRRVMPKRDWRSSGEFRADFEASTPEPVDILIEAGA